MPDSIIHWCDNSVHLKNMRLGSLAYGSLVQALCENKNMLENTVFFLT